MFVCAVGLPLHLQIESTIVETVVKYLISNVLPNPFPYPISASLKRFVCVMVATTS
jgi:hypothetical protein